MSADLTAFMKNGLDVKNNHQDFVKVMIRRISVLTKAIGEKETMALKLE